MDTIWGAFSDRPNRLEDKYGHATIVVPVNWLARLSLLLGLNAVPVVGVVGAGWTNATALVLYWCETVILVLLVALRIRLHRRWTNKRCHYCETLVKITRNGLSRTERSTGYFGTSFIVVALTFATAQVVFLSFILYKTHLLDNVSFTQLMQGLAATAMFLCVGFLIDLKGLRERPFAWIRDMSNAVLWRVFLVQIVIICGVVGIAWLGLPRITLITFVALKLYTDATSQLPQYDPAEAPTWMVCVFGNGFAQYWRAAKRLDQARAAAEEEIFYGRPMPLEKTPNQRTDILA